MAERQSTNTRSVPLPPSNNMIQTADDDDDDDDQNKNTTTAAATADAALVTAAMSKLTVGHEPMSPEDIPDCAVCLQRCIHPVRLPCSHVFCFLCVKGVAMQSGRCALCRKQITVEFFNNPTVLQDDKDTVEEVEPVRKDQYAWFYEGRNGWWQYEERTNQELEESYCKKLRTFELLIAGFVYTIDLDNMVQMRRSDPSRRRRIKRDLVSAPKKGIAGLKLNAAQHLQTEGDTASREVLGRECEKNNQASGGNPSPVHRTTQKTSVDNAIQVTQSEDVGALNAETEQNRTSHTDDGAYEVLPQSEAGAMASNNRSPSSKTNSANNSKKKPKPKPRMRDTVPQHPTTSSSSSSTSHISVATNDTYGLVAPQHHRGHSNSSADTQRQSGAVSRNSHPRALSHDDVDLNLNVSDTTRSFQGRDGDAAETDSQSRRNVRQRRKQQHSSDV